MRTTDIRNLINPKMCTSVEIIFKYFFYIALFNNITLKIELFCKYSVTVIIKKLNLDNFYISIITWLIHS